MKFLVSAGPTREKIDPVRFISNKSSGKMGYAIAEAAARVGHEVELVSGPVSISAPKSVELVRVDSAAEMACEIRKRAKFADIIIMAAAVADYRPTKKSTFAQKIKKKSKTIKITLEKTEDILASLGRTKKKGQILVGFAAETEDLLQNAEQKLKNKNLDWIIANDVSRRDIGFDSDENEVFLISINGEKIKIPKDSKKKIAKKILRLILRNSQTKKT